MRAAPSYTSSAAAFSAFISLPQEKAFPNTPPLFCLMVVNSNLVLHTVATQTA